MASPNVELARSVFAAWDRGDYSADEWAHPDIEFVIADGPAAGSWTGRAAMAASWRGVMDAWEELHTHAEEYRELDGGRVLVLNRFGGRGRSSGLDIAHLPPQAAALFQFHGGQATRLAIYWNRDNALTELGLAPESGSS